MAGSYPLLVTAHSERFVHIWNLNNIHSENYQPMTVRESPLKRETSSISCFGDGKGYCIGSIEGRVGVVNIDFDQLDTENELDFCFRCHRIDDKTKAIPQTDIYTVNSICFNKQYNTLATAGGDGTYVIWNKDTKARYRSSGKN